MPDIKPTEKAADLAALRDDITKLTASISELMPEHGYDKHGLPLPVGARRIFRRVADWGDEPYKEMNSLMKQLLLNSHIHALRTPAIACAGRH